MFAIYLFICDYRSMIFIFDILSIHFPMEYTDIIRTNLIRRKEITFLILKSSSH